MGENFPATRSEYKALVKRFPSYAKLIRRLIVEAQMTKRQKMTLGAGLAYLASPIDLVPGIIPVLGQLDDILVVLVCVRHVLREYDEEKVKELLAAENLSRQQINEDISLVKETMKATVKKTASVALDGLSRIGQAAIGKIKSLTD